MSDTFIRKKNILFFIHLYDAESIVSAAKDANLTKQHATRLVRRWREDGLVVRSPTLHGARYKYTEKGATYFDLLQDIYSRLMGEGEWDD